VEARARRGNGLGEMETGTRTEVHVPVDAILAVKAPGLGRGFMLGSAYRLTWTLVPTAAGPPRRAPSPLETTFTQSASLSL